MFKISDLSKKVISFCILWTKLILQYKSEVFSLPCKFSLWDICSVGEAVLMFFISVAVPNCPDLHACNLSTSTRVVKDLMRVCHLKSETTLRSAVPLWLFGSFLGSYQSCSIKWRCPKDLSLLLFSALKRLCYSCYSHSSCLEYK